MTTQFTQKMTTMSIDVRPYAVCFDDIVPCPVRSCV